MNLNEQSKTLYKLKGGMKMVKNKIKEVKHYRELMTILLWEIKKI